MDGISLPWSDVPLELSEAHSLARLVHERGGEKEIRFLRQCRTPLLPVWQDGQLLILPWGRRGGGLTWQRTVDAGLWQGAASVEVRAAAGLDGGIWYRIRQGIRGLVVGREAYLIVEPASHYYQVMTRREKMPVLIGERI